MLTISMLTPVSADVSNVVPDEPLPYVCCDVDSTSHRPPRRGLVLPEALLRSIWRTVANRSNNGKRGLGEFGWLAPNPTAGKAFIGEYLTIIPHPDGERKQVCVRQNKLLKFVDTEFICGTRPIWQLLSRAKSALVINELRQRQPSHRFHTERH
jgi:hypothetical protein